MEVRTMLEYIIFLTIVSAVAIAASVHYMHKAGIDILDIHK
jgi:hypothetical protein